MDIKRKEITKRLSNCLERHIKANDTRVYWAKEVTFDYGTKDAGRVDYMRYKPKNNTVSGIEKGDFYCYEIKSCLDDFCSKHGHNFIGDFNYYILPQEVFREVREEIPDYIGCYIPVGRELEVAKKAKRRDRNRATSEMLLMMFRSCARDRTNFKGDVSYECI